MTASPTTTDALARLAAMRAQEEDVSCYNYFVGAASPSTTKRGVDASSRSAMIDWLALIQRQWQLKGDTVWVAASYLDRYLSSGRGNSAAALQDKYRFQLAGITAFYLAVKLQEEEVDLPVALLERGYYPESDILAMEADILYALDWRTSTPTPFDFVREYVELLPVQVDEQSKEAIVGSAVRYIERATGDYCITFYKPSVVGAACLCSALLSSDILDAKARLAFWMTLAEHCDLLEVMEVENKILEGKTPEEPARKASDDAVKSKEEVGNKILEEKTPSQAKPARKCTSEDKTTPEAKPVVESETATTHPLGSFLSKEHKEGGPSSRVHKEEESQRTVGEEPYMACEVLCSEMGALDVSIDGYVDELGARASEINDEDDSLLGDAEGAGERREVKVDVEMEGDHNRPDAITDAAVLPPPPPSLSRPQISPPKLPPRRPSISSVESPVCVAQVAPQA